MHDHPRDVSLRDGQKPICGDAVEERAVVWKPLEFPGRRYDFCSLPIVDRSSLAPVLSVAGPNSLGWAGGRLYAA
jgi:hypothetical protein